MHRGENGERESQGRQRYRRERGAQGQANSVGTQAQGVRGGDGSSRLSVHGSRFTIRS